MKTVKLDNVGLLTRFPSTSSSCDGCYFKGKADQPCRRPSFHNGVLNCADSHYIPNPDPDDDESDIEVEVFYLWKRMVNINSNTKTI